MSVCSLLERVTVDTTGKESPMRVFGARELPEEMTIQVAITGTASVQIQGRISKDAPWTDVGQRHEVSALAYLKPIPFLRAVATGVADKSSVSVWATWGW